MSDVCVKRDVRPGSGRVRVAVIDESTPFNPAPVRKIQGETETTMELYLSQERLELLCGTKQLSQVTSLEICVQSPEYSLGNFGSYLPNLVLLKMNNSVLISVRDLGTTLSHLQILWMSCCCLQDLDGISSLSSLRELYLAFNKVSDLSQVGMLDNLEVLDLEGNEVDDLVQVQYLSLCGKLQSLTLEGNPVCLQPNPTITQTDYNYWDAVRELVPQLRYLDNARVEDGRLGSSSTLWEDWAILRNCLRNSSPAVTEDPAEANGAYSRPTTARRASSTSQHLSSASTTGSRPTSATSSGFLSFPVSTPCSVDSDFSEVEEDSSTLTHGAGKILFCGNPAKAIRARREKLRTAPSMPTFTPRDLSIYVPEHMYDPQDIEGKDSGDVLAELRAWRETHDRRLQEIQSDRLPQILVVQHCNENEEADDDDEGEGFDNSSSDSCNEERSETSLDTSSSNSSGKSICTDNLNSVSTDADNLYCDNTHLPCPPLNSKSGCSRKKAIGIRTQRIQINLANSEQNHHFCSAEHKVGPATSTAQSSLSFKQQTGIKKLVPTSPTSITQSYEFPSLQEGYKESRVETDVYSLATKVNCQSSWSERRLQVLSE
ncbi:leucine-rich repeat-containing protein 56 isoform X1 [Corythoichthys intestinalis]|uniref:leucine-rich repeat-containing protein 56 isoform X1 n=1 Tax=Corythoichthys intestinalis TaxID=161448 RepID=UPI0025A634C8|nr:leucine-rich repeat-containing protein 56 isoform X1 [Corythoichthys intestinalis]